MKPPGNQKATFRTAPDNPPEAAGWWSRAATEPGCCWPDYAHWLRQRGGGEKAARRRLGAAGLRPTDPAPGTYVLDR